MPIYGERMFYVTILLYLDNQDYEGQTWWLRQ